MTFITAPGGLRPHLARVLQHVGLGTEGLVERGDRGAVIAHHGQALGARLALIGQRPTITFYVLLTTRLYVPHYGVTLFDSNFQRGKL